MIHDICYDTYIFIMYINLSRFIIYYKTQKMLKELEVNCVKVNNVILIEL